MIVACLVSVVRFVVLRIYAGCKGVLIRSPLLFPVASPTGKRDCRVARRDGELELGERRMYEAWQRAEDPVLRRVVVVLLITNLFGSRPV